jgi:hypothetical protein
VPIDDPTRLPGWWFWVLDNAVVWLGGFATPGVRDLLDGPAEDNPPTFLDNLNDNTYTAKHTVYIAFAGNKYGDYFGVCMSSTRCFSIGTYFAKHIYNYTILQKQDCLLMESLPYTAQHH